MSLEVINLNRRYSRAEMERLSRPQYPVDHGIKFIAVQRIEEADASYIIDPSNFGCSSDMKHRDPEKERGE